MGAAQQPDWAQDAERRLSEAGFRRGGARTAVIALLDRQPCALTAHDIERDLRDGGRAVGRASVYRILDELVSLGLVARVEVGQGVARYEPARGEAHHHHHMVCDRCGDVFPFADDELERTVGRLADRVAFDVAEHDIVLHGSCADCRTTDRGQGAASARAPRRASAAP